MKTQKRILPLLCTLLLIISMLLTLENTTVYAETTYTCEATLDGFTLWNDESCTYSQTHDFQNGSGCHLGRLYVGQQCFYAAMHIIYRSFVFFDTSSLPDDLNIVSAEMLLYTVYDCSVDAEFDIVIQNGQPTRPHEGQICNIYHWDDYYYGHYSGNGGSISSTHLTEGAYSSIHLNSVGISWINKTGITKLALRSSRDINRNAPEEDYEKNVKEYVVFDEQNGWKMPVLKVSTCSPPTASISPSSIVMKIGDSKTFTCSASDGTPPYSYQWRVNGESTGCTSSQYTFTAESEYAGTIVSIQCVVTDSEGLSAMEHVEKN